MADLKLEAGESVEDENLMIYFMTLKFVCSSTEPNVVGPFGRAW